jgi:D-proline dehydrogenase
MTIAVLGGGITGLFAAYHLERQGAEVEVFDDREPGALSVHAAGIIEPTTAYRTNTLAFLRRVWGFWRNGTCTFRRADGRWLFESLRQLEREPLAGSGETLLRLGRSSLATYAGLAAQQDDFGFAARGLLERYDDPAHFEEEKEEALARSAVTPVEVRAGNGDAGALFFPQVAWLDTERFTGRLLRELRKTKFVRERATGITLDGGVTTRSGTRRFDTVIAATGVSSRTLGVPLTGVKGYGWHLRSRTPVDVATIHVDRGIAVVPLSGVLKVTGGWDFDLTASLAHAQSIFEAVRKVVAVDEVLDFKDGSRPCTPDGLPTVGRKDAVIVANGGFRLGWSFAPALGESAARLALGLGTNDPFLARFCGALHSGSFA